MTDTIERAAIWRRVTASILDFFTIFFAGGYLIGSITGNISNGDVNLTGAPALALFALVVAYFFVGRRFAGGTLWDRIFRIGRPQPS